MDGPEPEARPTRSSARPWLEARVPPPLVGVLAGGIAWLFARAFPASPLPAGLRLGVAIAFLLAGLWLAGSAARTVARARTTLNPLAPDTATALVTEGVFQRSRNPMYLGMACCLAAWSAWLGTLAGLVGPVLFVAWMNRFQIAPEERALGRLFGPAYAAYRESVRRWL